MIHEMAGPKIPTARLVGDEGSRRRLPRFLGKAADNQEGARCLERAPFVFGTVIPRALAAIVGGTGCCFPGGWASR